VAALNAAFARRVPAALAADLLPDARPGVVFFFKSDCACSRGFAGWASTFAAHLDKAAACTAVIEGSDTDARDFAAASGLALPFIAESGSGLARDWGVRKAGAFALVNQVASWLLVVTGGIVLLAMAVFGQTEWLAGATRASGWAADMVPRFVQAADLAVVLFPYLVFVCLAAAFSAALQTLQRFLEPFVTAAHTLPSFFD
jgi:putative peptidoglycan lipid II flippase